jgi:hypothetical protein
MTVPDYLDLPDFDAVFRTVLDWDGLGFSFHVNGQEFSSFHRATRSKTPRDFRLRPRETFLYTCGAIDLCCVTPRVAAVLQLAGSSILFQKSDNRGPPLLYGSRVGGVVAKTAQDHKLLRLWCSLINALAHPDRVRAVGIAVHYQKWRMAVNDGCDIVPLVRKHMCHPSWNAPGVNSALAR